MGSGASVTEDSRPVKTGVWMAGPGASSGPSSAPAPVPGLVSDPAPDSSPGPARASSSSPVTSSAPVSSPRPLPVPRSGSSVLVPGLAPDSSSSPGPTPGQTPPQSAEVSQVNQTFIRTPRASEDVEQLDVQAEDIQSLKSEQVATQGLEEEERMGRGWPLVTDGQGEDVFLDFESFRHNDGTLYSCFSHHGNRVYVDESQNLQPFSEAWLSQGCFLTPWDQNVVPQSPQLQAPPTRPPAVPGYDRSGSVHIQGRGTLVTYMFEERVNTCRFWDPGSGAWLLLPLRWELEVDFVRARVQRVMSALPGLLDQQEITAALRQCSYDPEEVVSVFLALFGDVLLQAPPSRDPASSELNSFRAVLERDQAIEELRQKLQNQKKEADHLLQRNSYLSGEVQCLTQVVQNLHQRLAEAEAEQHAAQEKVRSLQNRRAPTVSQNTSKPSVEPGQLHQLSCLTRQLNISNKQLGSTVLQALEDMKNQLGQLQEVPGKLVLVEQEAEQLRSLYRKEAVERRFLYNKLLELQGNIRVFCRCRRTMAFSSCLETTNEEEVLVVQKGSRKKFRNDKVYGESSTQEDVFAGTLDVITSCVDGYNVCILAYGQTGSGKTFTMMGTKEQPGVNIRSIRELLRVCALKEKVSYTLKISMLEIYNENLKDLLAKSDDAILDIRAQGKSVSVPALSWIQVRSEADILAVMETGEKNRRIASTKMNTQSSRSHLVVALQVEGSDQVSGLASRGTLTLCDLAGSERISKTEAEGQRLLEAAAINKSLTALGQVFSALKCNALHVPFRNSKLTHLLQPCLSGDAKCCVFVNVSPDVTNVLETLSTLQFGASIRQVSLGKATKNAAPRSNHAVK